MASIKDIPQFPRSHYEIDVSWDSLEHQLAHWMERSGSIASLNLDPDYQREHVWTREQQINYIEYALRGGEVGRNITFNCPGWMSNWKGPFELVDGKQRLEAVRSFLRDEFRAFGYLCSEFDSLRSLNFSFRFRVCTIPDRAGILQLYLNINAGGTPHTEEELTRVRALLEEAKQ